jgi:hypothetical protein
MRSTILSIYRLHTEYISFLAYATYRNLNVQPDVRERASVLVVYLASVRCWAQPPPHPSEPANDSP